MCGIVLSRKCWYCRDTVNFHGHKVPSMVESLLNLESSDNVGVVGIYEDPKIAKSYITRFAFELYYKIKYKFRAASFLVDVSKQLRVNTANGLENLHKELLSDMGVETMQELQRKRVLLVLERVDSEQHLKLLVEMGVSDWFGGGSRILIATENRNLFEDCPAVMNGVKLEKHCIREGELVKEKIVKEKKVVGFVKEFIDVINQLKEEDSNGRSVVSIVGMGGSGKTTLARMIYDSDEVTKVFPCRAWATVSKQCIEKEVYRNLLKSLKVPKSKYEKLSKEELKKKVRECLNGQSGKYLIVLDDVWNTQAWNKLEHLLPEKNNGSRILMTTRNDRVANHAMSKEPHHQLGPLDEEESWELFRSEVFGREECPSDLESIGKSIAKSCKGLPLAIVTIAGVVKKRKRSKTEWESIEKLIPHWCDDDDIDRMKKILKMSYDDLPKKLKPCFLYLGVFLEDYPIKVREIIRLWITEGFIQVRETGTSKAPPQPEDIGEEYLKELVDRNLVEVARRRRSDGEGVKTFRIHDLFRDLCISESNKEDDDNTKSNINSRRLSFTGNARSYVCSAKSNQSTSICSLFVCAIDFDWSSGILDNTQSVNVLYVDIFGGRAPSMDLEELIHLMYLKIDGPPEVPIRIGEFKQMRHLRSQGCVQLQLDREGSRDILQNLQSLCYVRADSVLATLIENGCFPNLKTLGLVLYPEDKQGGGRTEELRRLRGLSNLHNLKLKFDHTKHIHLPALPIDTFEFVSKLTKITLVIREHAQKLLIVVMLGVFRSFKCS
ncbi:disease resistance protein RPP13-like [Arachis duranensis]|uniref:Disease resistance protein RPP13-like n=1 Tax=Arachis duranensis TaxID=130453 RepID=A0A9C6TMG3_ARADU|nr:disease resistance protein RPP13-like [Arachis duranensis]